MSRYPLNIRLVSILLFAALQLFFHLLPVRAYSAQLESTATNNLEQLKSFLLNRPAIESVVIESSNIDQSLPSNAKTPGPASPVTRYQGACENENFYMRQIEGDVFDEAPFGKDTPFSVGRSGKIIWHANSSYALKSILSDDEAINFLALGSHPSTNGPLQVVSTSAGIMNRFLAFGLIDVLPNSFQFEGSNFRCHLSRGASADGEFILEEKKVSAIRFHIIGHDKYVISELKYDPDPLFPKFLPNKVVQSVYDKTGKFANISMAFRILSLKLAERELASSFFLPDKFYNIATSPQDAATNKHITAQLFSSNGAIFQLTGGDQLVKVPLAKSHAPLPARVFFFAILGTILVLPVLWVWLRTLAQKRNARTVEN